MRVRVLLSILLLAYPGIAAAQFDSGQIAGVVRDQSGSATPHHHGGERGQQGQA